MHELDRSAVGSSIRQRRRRAGVMFLQTTREIPGQTGVATARIRYALEYVNVHEVAPFVVPLEPLRPLWWECFHY